MKKIFSVLLILIIVCAVFFGCSSSDRPSSREPVTLSMWHNYGGDMQQTMDELIDEFNSTVGKEKGIIINVTAISSSAELNESLYLIANDDPGAPEMPDIFTGYPKIGILFANKGMLCDFNEYFTEDELFAYVDSFIEEGIIDGGLYVFPIAKSTEVLYLNQTLFDRFSKATGASAEKLSTFEGICELSAQYYEWTDSLTPETENDGKQFFASDSWFNFAEVGLKQLDESIFKDDNTLATDSEKFAHIFNTVFLPATRGGIAIYDGYSSDLSKTGDLVCSTGSSAGILFYGDTITHPDNTVENVEYSILPYPVFEGGQNIALQRGGGLMVAKSDAKKEYAACEFIKWLTASEQNIRFIFSTGYIPVTKKAFEDDLEQHIAAVPDTRVKKMLTSVASMYENYTFFTAPTFEALDDLSSAFEESFKAIMNKYRAEYLSGNVCDPSAAIKELK